MAPSATFFATLKAQAQEALPPKPYDRKRARDSTEPVNMNDKQCGLANLTGAKPTKYKKSFPSWSAVDDFLTGRKSFRERYSAKYGGDPASGDLKWLLDQLAVFYDPMITHKQAIGLWIKETKGIRVWQAATFAIDYSLGPDFWKDLTQEQAEHILDQLQENPNNRNPRSFDNVEDSDDEIEALEFPCDAGDFTAGGSLERHMAALDAGAEDADDVTIAALNKSGAKKAGSAGTGAGTGGAKKQAKKVGAKSD